MSRYHYEGGDRDQVRRSLWTPLEEDAAEPLEDDADLGLLARLRARASVESGVFRVAIASALAILFVWFWLNSGEPTHFEGWRVSILEAVQAAARVGQ